MKKITCFKAAGSSIWKGEGVLFESGKVAVHWICKKDGIDLITTANSVAELTQNGDVEITNNQILTSPVTYTGTTVTLNTTPHNFTTTLLQFRQLHTLKDTSLQQTNDEK
jgi:hypothetical protein